MPLRISILLSFYLFSNFSFAQKNCSPPSEVTDIYFSNSSLWAIGYSTECGKGIYKYFSSKWTYYGHSSASKITASASGKPFFIDQNHNLYELTHGKWENIQQNVMDASGSSKSSTIWAVVNDQLMSYSRNEWVKSDVEKMTLKELAVIDDNSVYAIDELGNILMLRGDKWNSFSSKKGKFLSSSSSSLYLSQEMISPVIPNVSKCYRNPSWQPTIITGNKITIDNNQNVYYTDAFNRLMLKYIDSIVEITNSSIEISNLNSIAYNSNANFIDSVTGETPIFSAVRNNDLNSVYAFVSKGANINFKNKRNETPLILASKLGRTQIAIKIAEISFWKPSIYPNLEQQDKQSKNALWYAIENRNIDLVKTLLDRGANPQSLDFLSQIVNYPSNDQKKTRLIDMFIDKGSVPSPENIKKTIQLNHESCFFQLTRSNLQNNFNNESLNEFLKEAILVKNTSIAKHCIEMGSDANLLTPFALENEDKNLMIFCLDKAANPKEYIDYAISKNDSEFLLLCIDKYNGSKEQALSTACKANKKDFAITILEKGADPNASMIEMINQKDTAFVSLLLKYNADAKNPEFINKAIEKQSIEIVKMLIDKGAEANNGIIKAIEVQSLEITTFLLPFSDTTNQELIKTSASRDNIEILKLLIKYGSNPQNGMLPGLKANKVNNVSLLIEKGALVNSDNFILTAVNNKSLEMCRLLVENGANVSVGLKPAIEKNASTIVEFLLIKGAVVDDNNYLVYTTINKNYTQTLKVLIDYKFTLDFTDDKNNSMLHLSCKKGFYNITKMLIESGKIQVDVANNFGLTPLMIVVMSNNKDLNFCKLLVENGANVNAKNNDGVRVRKMAKGIKVKKYLKQNGAKKR